MHRLHGVFQAPDDFLPGEIRFFQKLILFFVQVVIEGKRQGCLQAVLPGRGLQQVKQALLRLGAYLPNCPRD